MGENFFGEQDTKGREMKHKQGLYPSKTQMFVHCEGKSQLIEQTTYMVGESIGKLHIC